MQKIRKTSERMLPEKVSGLTEELMLIRHLFAYELVKSKLNVNNICLDLGCGVGYGTFLLSKAVKNIMGIDISKKAVNYANSKYGASNCQFMIYDGLHVNYVDESFDVIVSFQVIEHVDNDINFIKEVYRLLRPGGSFFLTTPNKIFRLFPLQKPWNRFHIREYYPFELRELLSNSFKYVEILGICGSNEIVDMENRRIHRIQKKQKSLLNKLVPSILISNMGSSLKRLAMSNSLNEINSMEKKMFDSKSYFLTHDDVYRSLDLFAVCKK